MPGVEHAVEVKSAKMDLSGVPRHNLLNIGLFSLEAYAQEALVHTLNMVVHVSRDKQDESVLLKTVLNPLD